MGDDWTSFIQDVAGDWAHSAIDARYQQPYEIQKLAMQQFAPNGMAYQEGQAVQASVSNGAVSASIPMSWLILGAVVLFAMSED